MFLFFQAIAAIILFKNAFEAIESFVRVGKRIKDFYPPTPAESAAHNQSISISGHTFYWNTSQSFNLKTILNLSPRSLTDFLIVSVDIVSKTGEAYGLAQPEQFPEQFAALLNGTTRVTASNFADIYGSIINLWAQPFRYSMRSYLCSSVLFLTL
jgi:hypothetical protein